MAARELAAGEEGSRQPPPPRPTLSVPPRSAAESLFAAEACSLDASPGPLTLAASRFHGSFTQLLVGAMGSPATAHPPSPAGLSPTALLGFHQGNFEMSHQQVLAQVTAEAAHSPYSMLNRTDYSTFSSMTTSALTSQHVNSSANMTSMQETPTLPLQVGNNDTNGSNKISQGLQSSAITVVKPADDGYNWRKYGQKAVKGAKYPRSYYKCTHLNCPVKKKVERSVDGQIAQIVYRGQHNHEPPPKRSKDGGGLLSELDDFNENEDASTRSEPGSQDYYGKPERSNGGMVGPSMSRRREGGEHLSGSSDIQEEGDDEVRIDVGDAGDANADKGHASAPAHRIIVQTTSELDFLDDGYRWRKYGQKVVKGNPHPRSYYKCTYQGCDVKKHVERSSQDPKAVITTYEGKHNHDIPAARNRSHATGNANMLSSSSLPHPLQNTLPNSQASLHRTGLHNDHLLTSALELKEENGVT